mgnify:CR=1 FL=1
MYVDETIIAGALVIISTVGFLIGFGYYIYKDSHKKPVKIRP